MACLSWDDLSVKQAMPAMHVNFCVEAKPQQLHSLNVDLLKRHIKQYAGGGINLCLLLKAANEHVSLLSAELLHRTCATSSYNYHVGCGGG